MRFLVLHSSTDPWCCHGCLCCQVPESKDLFNSVWNLCSFNGCMFQHQSHLCRCSQCCIAMSIGTVCCWSSGSPVVCSYAKSCWQNPLIWTGRHGMGWAMISRAWSIAAVDETSYCTSSPKTNIRLREPAPVSVCSQMVAQPCLHQSCSLMIGIVKSWWSQLAPSPFVPYLFYKSGHHHGHRHTAHGCLIFPGHHPDVAFLFSFLRFVDFEWFWSFETIPKNHCLMLCQAETLVDTSHMVVPTNPQTCDGRDDRITWCRNTCLLSWPQQSYMPLFNCVPNPFRPASGAGDYLQKIFSSHWIQAENLHQILRELQLL